MIAILYLETTRKISQFLGLESDSSKFLFS